MRLNVMYPDVIANRSLKCHGQWLSIQVYGPSDYPRDNLQGWFCDFTTTDEILKQFVVYINWVCLAPLTEAEEKRLVDWFPKAGFQCLVDRLCDRLPSDIQDFADLRNPNPSLDPQAADMAFYRQRCRMDILRVIEDRLKMQKSPVQLVEGDAAKSILHTRLYDDADVEAAFRYWEKEGIVRPASQAGMWLIDDTEDAKVRKLVAEYDWEETLVGSSEQLSGRKPGDMEYDVFVCHASEDKEPFVDGLVAALKTQQIRVWYDTFCLKLGDSLRRKIDEGLAKSRFGIVVLSKAFLGGKPWTQYELDGLLQKDLRGEKVILPVWLDVTPEDVKGYSFSLADRTAARAQEGTETVVAKILEVVRSGA